MLATCKIINMLHQLISTICGIALYTHANACSITLKQATIETNQMIDSKVQTFKSKLENTEIIESFRNDYTAAVFYLGTIAYKQELVFNYDTFSFRVRPNNFIAGVRWMF